VPAEFPAQWSALSVISLVWLSHVAWVAGLLPLVACALAVLSGKTPSTGAVLLSVAFAVSFVADSLSKLLLMANLPNLWPSYIGGPLQFALLLLAVTSRQSRIVAGFFLLLVAVSILRGPFSTPETAVQIVAGAWVALVAWRSPRVIDYRDPIILYCAGTLPFLLILGMHEPAPGLWLRAWAAYQGVRVMEEQGLPRYRKLRAELEQTRQQSARLRREVVALEEHVGRLRHDPGALERIARDEIGMLRKDELVFQFDD
jgi:cell division protein FtsB